MHVQEVCLHAALAADHDQAVLQAALRRLQPPQVVRLIAYLLKWVDRHPGESIMPSLSGRKLSFPFLMMRMRHPPQQGELRSAAVTDESCHDVVYGALARADVISLAACTPTSSACPEPILILSEEGERRVISVQLMMRQATEAARPQVWCCQDWRRCCGGHAQPWTRTSSPLQGCQPRRSKRCCRCMSASRRLCRCAAYLEQNACLLRTYNATGLSPGIFVTPSLLPHGIFLAMQMSQGVVALSGAMEHINSQAPLPTFSPSNPQQYFVELLDLGVRAA